MSAVAFTSNQREHLSRLLTAGAVSPQTGVGPLSLERKAEWLNPMVTGILRGWGLVEARSLAYTRGPSWTEYWLTDEGRKAAEALTRGAATHA